MSIEFPITPESGLTILGAATIASLSGLWLKQFLGDWRYTPLLILGLAEIVANGAQLIVTMGQPSAAAMYTAAMLGFFGATLAVFGYEVVTNALGLIGVGKRSDAGLDAQAMERAEVYMACVGKAPRG